MIRLHCDPHPATTTTAKEKKKPSSSASAASSTSTSAAAQLLLRCRGRSAAAKDESIELFSALLRDRQPPDRRNSVHAEARGEAPDSKGKARRDAAAAGGGGGGNDELLSTGIGKHDYDWLLTPPGSPLWSPATSAAACRRVSTATPATPSRLERARSASYAKCNSPLSLKRGESRSPASRLARSSSATSQQSVAHAPGIVFSGRTSHGRTLSSASASSINTLNNSSVASTLMGSSSATSPRTPATARSTPAAAARPRHRDKTQAVHVFGSVAGQPKASAAAPTIGSRTRTTPGAAGTSSPRSTTWASRQPVRTRRGANAVARSGLVRQSAAAGSTAQAAPPAPRARNVNLAAGASHGAPLSRSKSRQAPPSEKQRNSSDGVAAASSMAQRYRPSTPSVAHRSPRNSDGRRNIDVANTTTAARRAFGLASSAGANGGSATSTGCRNKSADADGKCLWQGAARHLIAAARREPSPTRRGSRTSVTSRSRLGMMSSDSSGAGTTTVRRPTPEKGKPLAVAAAKAASPRVAVAPDAFPSTRYDAMLLREDPKNLTWLHGCDDDVSAGAGLVDASLESFGVPAGLSSMPAGVTLNLAPI